MGNCVSGLVYKTDYKLGSAKTTFGHPYKLECIYFVTFNIQRIYCYLI